MLTLTIILVLFCLILFFVIGSLHYKKIKNTTDLFSASSGLNRYQISRALLAANISLSAGLAWFIGRGSVVGLYILWGPVTILAGLLISIYFINKYLKNDIFRKYGSLATQLDDLVQSKLLNNSIIIITALGSITILLIEINVCMSIVSLFTKEGGRTYYILLISIMGIITIYALLGGLLGVIRNDWIQNTLVFTFIFAVITTIVVNSILFSPIKALTLFDSLFPSQVYDKGFTLGLIIWLIIINLVFIPSQLRFWQLAGGAKSRIEFFKGVHRAAITTALAWSGLTLVGVFVAYDFGLSSLDLSEMSRLFYESKNTAIYWICFPLLSLAGISALVSTADSALISVSQAAADKIFPNHKSVKLGRSIILFLGFLICFFYIIVFEVMKMDLLNILFSAFSLFSLIAPPLIMILLNTQNIHDNVFERLCGLGLAVSGLFVITFTYFDTQTIDSVWVGIFGFLISLAFSYAGHVYRTNKHKLQSI